MPITRSTLSRSALVAALALAGTTLAGVDVPSRASAAPPVKNGDLVFVSFVYIVSSQAPGAASYGDLADGGVPEYSPDGRRIAYTRDGVWVRDVAGGPERRVSDIDGTGLAWSPDGTRIVVAHDNVLDEVGVADGAVRRVHVEAGGPVTEPAWSPDGSRIAFSTGATIKLVRPDGTGLRHFTRTGSINADPDWSPDSQTIAFVTDRYTGDGRVRAELVTLPRSGQGEPVRVSHLAYPQGIFLIDVAWSPDGRKIAVLQFNRNALPDDQDSDERFKVRAYLPDGSHSYSLTGPIAGDDGLEGLDWAPRTS